MIINTFKNLTQDEKLAIYMKLLDFMNREEIANDETIRNIRKTVSRQKGKPKYRRTN